MEEEVYLTAAQVMQRLNITIGILERLRRSGKLTPVRIGASKRYRRSDVLRLEREGIEQVKAEALAAQKSPNELSADELARLRFLFFMWAVLAAYFLVIACIALNRLSLQSVFTSSETRILSFVLLALVWGGVRPSVYNARILQTVGSIARVVVFAPLLFFGLWWFGKVSLSGYQVWHGSLIVVGIGGLAFYTTAICKKMLPAQPDESPA